jgi:hypothetical protein
MMAEQVELLSWLNLGSEAVEKFIQSNQRTGPVDGRTASDKAAIRTDIAIGAGTGDGFRKNG